MPEPKLVSRIQIGELTLTGLLAFADKLARDLQDAKGECPFLWIFKAGPIADLFIGDWANDGEKYATVDAFRETLRLFPEIDAYASVGEMWIASYNRGERRATAAVRNDPRRKSALLIMARDRSGGTIQQVYEVTYDDEGKPSRTPLDWSGGSMGGYMENLFAAPTPLHPDAPKVADA